MNMKDIYVVIDGRKYLPLNMRMDSDGDIMIQTNRNAYVPGCNIPSPMELHGLMALKETVKNAKPRSNRGISIKNVIFNPPATIVFWSDDTKSVVKAQNGEEFDPEKGLAMAILKRIAGNKGSYYNDFIKWCKNYKVEEKMEIPNIDLLSPIAETFKKISDAIGKSNSINSIPKNDMLLNENLKSE